MSAPETDESRQAAVLPSGEGLGDLLEPLLQESCEGRLGSISWFKADWQRGGARTGRSQYAADNGDTVPVVVKVPVGPVEYTWNHRLQPNEDDPYGVTARLFASGTSLGHFDLGWIVMEKFPVGPLLGLPRDDAMLLMADVAARFYKRANMYPVDEEAKWEDWCELISRARESFKTNRLPEAQRWKSGLKKLQKNLDTLVSEWRSRPCEDWCHGDLHPANAMSRSNEPTDPAMLIDLAEVLAGHWVRDAVYLERLFWTRQDFLKKYPPVQLIAKHREELGLPGIDAETSRLADIRRILLAATAPAFLKSEGNPVYLDACLTKIETILPRLIA